jgi:hypothetical protein
MPKCKTCQDEGWVCEAHPDAPWNAKLPGGCQCNAGEPCPDCNFSLGRDDPPRMPPSFEPHPDKTN